MVTRPLKPIFHDPDVLAQKIEDYFSHCANSFREQTLKNGDVRIRQETPSMIGLALWLGCSKDALYAHIKGENRADLSEESNKQISDLLCVARDRCEKALLDRALDGDAESKIATMVLGNFGYAEKLEHDVSAVVTIEGATNSDVEDWCK